MNLNDMMADTSLTNLTWLADPKTYEPQDKDNNIKDELAIEWGSDVSAIDAGIEPTTIRDEIDVDANDPTPLAVVELARSLMNQGIYGKHMVNGLLARYDSMTVEAAMPELRKLVQEGEGIIGSVAIDLRGDIRAAISDSKKSPFRRHVACVIMTPEQIENRSDIETITSYETEGQDGSISGMFCASDTVQEQKVFSPLGLPVVAIGPLEEYVDEQYYKDITISLSNFGLVTEDEIEEIDDEDDDDAKVRKAFVIASSRYFNHDDSPSVHAVDKSQEYAMEGSELIAETFKGLEATEVDIGGPQPTVVEDTVVSDDDLLIEAGSPEQIDDFDLGSVGSKVLAVNPKQHGQEIEVVDEFSGISIDPAQYEESEFRGSSEFDIDEESEWSELDVDGGSDFVI